MGGVGGASGSGGSRVDDRASGGARAGPAAASRGWPSSTPAATAPAHGGGRRARTRGPPPPPERRAGPRRAAGARPARSASSASASRTASLAAIAGVRGGLGRDVGGRPGRRRLAGRAGQLVEQREAAELEQQHPEVPRVEQLDLDVRVQLAQPAQLAVLLAHELLLERRELDVQVEVGQVEVGREALDDVAVEVPADREGVRLVGPADRRRSRGSGRAPPRSRGRTTARRDASIGRAGSVNRRAPRGRRRGPRRGCAGRRSRPPAAGHREHVVLVDRRAASRGGPRPRVELRDGRRCRAPVIRDPRRRRRTRPMVRLPHAAQSSSTKARSPRSARIAIRSTGTAAPHEVQPAPVSRARSPRWSIGGQSTRRLAAFGWRDPRAGADTPVGYHAGHGRTDRAVGRDARRRPHDSFRHSYSKDKAQLVRRLSAGSRARSAGSRG